MTAVIRKVEVCGQHPVFCVNLHIFHPVVAAGNILAVCLDKPVIDFSLLVNILCVNHEAGIMAFCCQLIVFPGRNPVAAFGSLPGKVSIFADFFRPLTQPHVLDLLAAHHLDAVYFLENVFNIKGVCAEDHGARYHRVQQVSDRPFHICQSFPVYFQALSRVISVNCI